MRKVLISFLQYRQRDLLGVGRDIQKKMTGNSNFPTPTVALIAVDALLDDYAVAITDSSTGNKDAIAHKNVLKVSVAIALSQNGSYVNSVAAGDLEKLISSGYPVGKERQPVTVEVPVILAITQGKNMGEMIVRAKAQRAAKSWEFQCTKDPLEGNPQWTTVVSSRSTLTFADLDQGENYFFRVVVIGSNNQRLFCKPVSQYVMRHGVANAA